MGLQQSSRAWVDINKPRPWANCDRCGFRYFHDHLRWQFDWRGNKVQNLRIMVCQRCEDVPQPQLRPIIVGPDPYPVRDPRPGYAATQMGPQPPPFNAYIQPQPPIPPIPPIPPTTTYLTTDLGEVITDDLGNPIAVDTGSAEYVTDEQGRVVTDDMGRPIAAP